MWIPKTGYEIEQEFNSKPEDQYLEAKRIFVKSKEIAESICAMANSGGGTIVIGVDENKKTRVFSLTPIEITEQQNETIVYQAIKEYLKGLAGVNVYPVYEGEGRKKGYVVIVVPNQSDNLYSVEGKFYKRVGNIKASMDTNEVKAFYTKPQLILNPYAFLEKEMASPPFQLDGLGDMGYMFAVIKPMGQINLRTESRQSREDWFNLTRQFREKIIHEDKDFDEECRPYILDMMTGYLKLDNFLLYTTNLEPGIKPGHTITTANIANELKNKGYIQYTIHFDGTLSLFCGPIASEMYRAKFFQNKLAEQHLAHFIQFGGLLYEDTPSYKGNVFVILGLSGLEGSRSGLGLPQNGYSENEHKVYKETSATQLFDKGRGIAKELINPLLYVMNQ